MNQPKDVSQQRLNSVDDKRARLALQLVPESSNVEDNTVEILFYTGAEVVRYGYLDGEYQRYYLKFDMDSIDDTRINAGGIGLFLDNSWGEHSPNTRGQIGIALAGTRRHIEGRGHAVKFKLEDVSDFPPENDIRRAVTKIHKGELNNFSMGVGWTREIRDVIDEVVHVTGFNWQPCELTAVSYDADPGTTALNSQEGKMPGTTKTVTELDGQQVPGEAGSAPENAADNTAELSAAKKAGSAQEKARVQELTLLCTKFKCEDRLAEFVAQDVTVLAAKDEILAVLEQRQNLSGRPAGALPKSNTGITPGEDESDKQREAMEEALAFRMAPRLMGAPKDNPYVGKSMLSMAAIRASRGRGTPMLDTDEIVSSVMRGRDEFTGATPSDFPLIAGGAVKRYMLKSTNQYAQKFQQFANQRDFDDFRVETGVTVQYDSDTDLDKPILPGQAYPEVSLIEGGETRKPVKKGEFLFLTEELLRNNNINGFAGQATKAMNRYRRKESLATFTCLFDAAGASSAGQKMRDGKRAFIADHANFLTGEAFGQTPIEKMLKLLAQQKDGGVEMGLEGKILVVPTALQFTAEHLLNGQWTPTGPDGSKILSVQGLTLISDPLIDRFTTKGFMVMADPALIDTVVYGWLTGTNGPQVFAPTWKDENDSWAYKLRDIFAVACMEPKGAVFCPGA